MSARLHAIEQGSGRSVVLLHGFTGDGPAMMGVAASLPGYRAVLPDLPGHGRSLDLSAGAFTWGGCLDAVGDLVSAAAGGVAHVVGYSMGGRIALGLAAESPDLVDRLVLIGATPGIADPRERSERRASDEEIAGLIETEGVAAFVEHWLDHPLFATQQRLGEAHMADARRQRLANDAAGLAAALRGLGTGAQPSYWDRLDGIPVPVLVVVGEDDRKFRAIGERMVDRLPDGRLHVVPGTGHAAHVEDVAEVGAAIRGFFA